MSWLPAITESHCAPGGSHGSEILQQNQKKERDSKSSKQKPNDNSHGTLNRLSNTPHVVDLKACTVSECNLNLNTEYWHASWIFNCMHRHTFLSISKRWLCKNLYGCNTSALPIPSILADNALCGQLQSDEMISDNCNALLRRELCTYTIQRAHLGPYHFDPNRHWPSANKPGRGSSHPCRCTLT